MAVGCARCNMKHEHHKKRREEAPCHLSQPYSCDDRAGAYRIALKLRAQRPRAQGVGAADKEASQRGNAILPYLRAPGSFKRMLGGVPVAHVLGDVAAYVAFDLPTVPDPDDLPVLALAKAAPLAIEYKLTGET